MYTLVIVALIFFSLLYLLAIYRVISEDVTKAERPELQGCCSRRRRDPRRDFLIQSMTQDGVLLPVWSLWLSFEPVRVELLSRSSSIFSFSSFCRSLREAPYSLWCSYVSSTRTCRFRPDLNESQLYFFIQHTRLFSKTMEELHHCHQNATMFRDRDSFARMLIYYIDNRRYRSRFIENNARTWINKIAFRFRHLRRGPDIPFGEHPTQRMINDLDRDYIANDERPTRFMNDVVNPNNPGQSRGKNTLRLYGVRNGLPRELDELELANLQPEDVVIPMTGLSFFSFPEREYGSLRVNFVNDVKRFCLASYELPYCLYLAIKYNDYSAYIYELFFEPFFTLIRVSVNLTITDSEICQISTIIFTLFPEAYGVFHIGILIYTLNTEFLFQYYINPWNILKLLFFACVGIWFTPLLCLTHVFIQYEEIQVKTDLRRARLMAWLEMLQYLAIFPFSFPFVILRSIVVVMHDLCFRMPRPVGILFHWLWNTTFVYWGHLVFGDIRPRNEMPNPPPGPILQSHLSPHDIVVRSGRLYTLKGVEIHHWRPLRDFVGWKKLSEKYYLKDYWSVYFDKNTPHLRAYYISCLRLLQGDSSCLPTARQLCERLRPRLQSNAGIHAALTLGKLAHQFCSFTTIEDFLVCFANEIAFFGLNYNHWYNYDNLDAIIAFFRPGTAVHQSFVESDAYRDIAGFITSLVVTLGFGSDRFIPINLLRRFGSAYDLVRYIATLPAEIVEAVRDFWVTGSVPSYFLGGLNKLTAKANRLIAVPIPKGDNPDQKQLRLKMSIEAKDLLKEIERCSPRDRPMPEVHVRLLEKLKVYAASPENQIRPEPFIIVLYGTAGTGKTDLARNIHSLVSLKMGWSSVDNPPSNSMYAFRGGKHLDGVEHPLSKHTFIFDDFLQSRTPEDISTEMLMFHKFCGATTTPMPMASIEGKTQANDWRPNLVILCTNKRDVFDTSKAGDAFSYARRVDLFIEISSDKVFSRSIQPGPSDRRFSFHRLVVTNGLITHQPVNLYNCHNSDYFPDVLAAISRCAISAIQYSLEAYDSTMNTPRCSNGLEMRYHCGVACYGGCDFISGTLTPYVSPITPITTLTVTQAEHQSPQFEASFKQEYAVVAFIVFCSSLYAVPNLVSMIVALFVVVMVFCFTVVSFGFSLIERKFGLFSELYGVGVHFLYYYLAKKTGLMTDYVASVDKDSLQYGFIGALYMSAVRKRFNLKVTYFVTTFAALLGTYIFVRNKKSSTHQADLFAIPDNSTLRDESVRQDRTAAYIRQKLVISASEVDAKDFTACSVHYCRNKHGDNVAVGIRMGNYVLTTLHSLSDGMIFEAVRKTGVYSNSNYQTRLTANVGEITPVDIDLGLARVPETPAKDFSGLLLARSDVMLFKEASGFAFCAEYPGAGFDWHPVKLSQLDSYVIGSVTYVNGFSVRYPFPTYVGLCGAPILISRPNNKGGLNCFLAAIHHGGLSGANSGFARPVCKESLSVVRSVEISEMTTHSVPTLQAIGTKGANNLRLAGVAVGNIDTMNRVRTNLRPSRLAKRFPHILDKFAVPSDVAYVKGVGVGPLYQQWDYPPTLGVVDLVAANKALEDIVEWDLKHFGPHFKDEQPLSVDQAVRGIPGTVRSMNLHTSSGYGFPGPKARYVSVEEDLVIDDGVRAQIDEYEKLCFEQPENVIPVVINTFVKDEVRKRGKSYRWIGVFPIFFLILCRMFLTIFFHAWKKLPTLSECWVGVNATGKAWQELCRHMEKNDDEWYWCVDFKFWDRTYSELSRHWFNLYMARMIDHTSWPRHLKLIAICIIRTFTFIYVIIHTVVFVMTWYEQSGDPITVFANSWFQRFLLRYWYYKVTGSEILDFRENVQPNTYGDDGTGRARRLPGLNQFSLAACAADFGCVVTSADKGELKSEVQWDELSFLKRGLVRDPEYGGYRGPLEEESIEKMMCWFDISSSINEETWLPDVVDNVMREYFIHGREKFHEREAHYKKLCREEDIPYKAASYDEMMEKWKAGDFKTWSF